MAAPQTVKVGIIGAGDIVSAHLPVLLNMEGVAVCWIMDADESRARRAAKAYRIPFHPIPADLSHIPPADVALLAIPYGARPPYYEALSRWKMAVYAEKPLALTVDEHRRLCGLFAPERFVCGFQFRASSRIQLLRAVISKQLFGPLRRVRFGYGGPGVQIGGKASANLSLSGGGSLFEVAVHGLDAALYCTQATDFRVRNVQMDLEDGFDLHTCAELELTLPGGDAVDWEITSSCLAPTISGLQCDFERATTFFSLWEKDPGIRVTQGSETFRLTSDSTACLASSPYQFLFRHWRTFIDGLDTRAANDASAERSLMTTAVVEELYRRRKASSDSASKAVPPC